MSIRTFARRLDVYAKERADHAPEHVKIAIREKTDPAFRRRRVVAAVIARPEIPEPPVRSVAEIVVLLDSAIREPKPIED